MIYSLSKGCQPKLSVCNICNVGLLKSKRLASYKIKEKYINRCFKILQLEPNADQEAVRSSFLTLCKKYHPDSLSPEADSSKFQQIDEAYRSLLKKFAEERGHVDDDIGEYGLYYDKKRNRRGNKEVEEFDIKHTAPQHRQYLSWEGVGSGTPSQRQRQHTRFRAMKAAERVYEHRTSRVEDLGTSLTVQERRRVHEAKTRYGMERLVEDLIQESMAKGEFDNLSGAGKPLPQSKFNPYVDFVTHKMNEVMIENGFNPEWITLGREIEEDIKCIKKKLYEQSYHRSDEKKWKEIVCGFEDSVKALNKKIQLYNLVVPILSRQRVLFNLSDECEQVLKMPPPNNNSSILNNKPPPKVSEVSSNLLEAISSFFVAK